MSSRRRRLAKHRRALTLWRRLRRDAWDAVDPHWYHTAGLRLLALRGR